MVILNQLKTVLPSIFNNYQWRGFELAQYYFYDYFKLISIISNKTGKGIPFIKKYSHFLSITHCLYNASPCKTLVALFSYLSLNKADKDTIQGACLDTDTRQNDVDMILLGLFVLWNRLQSYFLLYNAIVLSYSSLP